MSDGIKHLDYIQAAIARMAGNAFTIKGWSITVTTAVIGVASKTGDHGFALLGLLPIVLFWGLDAYYLALERRFRRLFAVVAQQVSQGQATTFEMSPGAIGPREVVEGVKRPALLYVHGPLLLVVMGVFLVGFLRQL